MATSYEPRFIWTSCIWAYLCITAECREQQIEYACLKSISLIQGESVVCTHLCHLLGCGDREDCCEREYEWLWWRWKADGRKEDWMIRRLLILGL